MRVIKFRGKDLDTGEWAFGDLHTLCDKPHIHTEKTSFPFAGKRSFVDENTICQFTGVIDPNGHEIYENDIVGYTDSETKEVSVFGVVKWSSEGNFYINTNNCRNYEDDAPSANVGYMMPQHKALSIIGNIFDNKELLKVE